MDQSIIIIHPNSNYLVCKDNLLYISVRQFLLEIAAVYLDRGKPGQLKYLAEITKVNIIIPGLGKTSTKFGFCVYANLGLSDYHSLNTIIITNYSFTLTCRRLSFI
ncbi:hypothetical protein PPL_00138 [Heterostelium album PN500]|uniref:Uncharacterized protein n=1 Tax=Heterostelium pallidum (strain ATCC 26659 / Pp 5 / PN500) TaxID=670386 RepID=D3AVM3_HETP5|nr:hypothetical protein PPL_00138 [Heterostelium album PN500]EFA86346.1 hypothetical protein PPL_00138 [Heterostelium album PN500]|eukprot:XP_020438451.1 hypothetical protein PPL_00138 [Heterostelium album PN500]